MKESDNIRIAVAEISLIVRSGIVHILKHLPNLKVQTIEVMSPEGLENCLHTHTPDILLINPTFGGWFSLEDFRADEVHCNVKCIALNCNIIDNNILQAYDESITLYDDYSSLEEKLTKVIHCNDRQEEEDNEKSKSGTLSQREKEIIVYVVKGYSNKEIAEKLYLSIHTVITHRRNIARKLEIQSVAGLTIYAIINKLVELNEVKL